MKQVSGLKEEKDGLTCVSSLGTGFMDILANTKANSEPFSSVTVKRQNVLPGF